MHIGSAAGIVCKHARLLVAALLMLRGASTAIAGTRYGPARGVECFRVVPDDEVRCPGPAGYVAVVVHRNQVVRINFGHPKFLKPNTELPSADLLWRGQGVLLDNRIEWHLHHGRPFAAIVRIFTFTESDRPLQQLLIARVTRSGSCEIGRIDASDGYSIGIARIIAESWQPLTECDRVRPSGE